MLGDVEEVEGDGVGEADGGAVGEDDDAELFQGEHRDVGVGAEFEGPGVAQAEAAGVVVGDVPAEPVEAGVLAGGGGGRLREDLRLVGAVEGAGGDDALAVEDAVAELEPQPARHVAGGGTDAAGGRLGVGVADVAWAPGAVGVLHVGGGVVGGVAERGELGAGAGHAGGLEEGVRGQLLPAGAPGGGDGLGGGGEAEVGVRVADAERVEGLQAEVVEDVRLVVAEVFEEVPGVVGEAAAVGEEVGGGDVVADPGVLQREAGEGDVLVPVGGVGEGAGDDGGGDGLGERGDLEDGVGVDLAALTGPSEAEALEVEDLVVVDDGHGGAGDAGRPHHGGDGAVEAGHGLLDGGVGDLGPRGWGRGGGGGRRRRPGGQRDEHPGGGEHARRTHAAIVLPDAAPRPPNADAALPRPPRLNRRPGWVRPPPDRQVRRRVLVRLLPWRSSRA